jgi:hypothetical protein
MDDPYIYSFALFKDTMDYYDSDNDVLYSSSSKIIENALGYENPFYEIYSPNESSL